ncbi:hypothetical protein TGARI_220585 [Toxoplasma gondii ARI]|uniref:Uncharacterized protein n=1 Tax=Toxoplasma gondii ARI TaxID=1074872 RepID=A0A139XXT1_TOXGO|nr:hypothetical protein TGARI_220585 [Toxoplasma gondii ARI]
MLLELPPFLHQNGKKAGTRTRVSTAKSERFCPLAFLFQHRLLPRDDGGEPHCRAVPVVGHQVIHFWHLSLPLRCMLRRKEDSQETRLECRSTASLLLTRLPSPFSPHPCATPPVALQSLHAPFVLLSPPKQRRRPVSVRRLHVLSSLSPFSSLRPSVLLSMLLPQLLTCAPHRVQWSHFRIREAPLFVRTLQRVAPLVWQREAPRCFPHLARRSVRLIAGV